MASPTAAAPSDAKPPPPPLTEEVMEWLSVRGAMIKNWAQRQPMEAIALGLFLLVLIYFFGLLRLFYNYSHSTFGWAWVAWNPETNYEHAPIIPVLSLFMILHKLPDLRDERPASSSWGLLWVGFGAMLFFLAARTLQPRVAMVALPCLLFGMVLHVWGSRVGRAMFFPIMFLLFAVPLNFIQHATVNNLQQISTFLSSTLCNLIGIKIEAFGTTMRSADASFQFEIAESCSGINSLMAITMLTAIFVHYTQDRLWKKLFLFSLSAVFAVVGNVARVTTIMVVAKFVNAKFAGGVFHDYSAFIVSFPIAFAAMWGASRLINAGESAVSEGLKRAEVQADGTVVAPRGPTAEKYDY